MRAGGKCKDKTNKTRAIFSGLTALELLELRNNHAPKTGQPETAGAHPPYPGV